MYIIVGIDPGKTMGIACLDLSGGLVFAGHSANEGLSWAVSTLSSVGIPVIVAGDKQNPSRMVRRINAAVGARLFTPEKEESIAEKRAIGNGARLSNQHERDAYVAAVSAFKRYSSKFRQAEHAAREMGISDIDGIKAKVVMKHSIDEAIGGRRANRR
jgi:predicted RNase H-like nuclease (RuvC/YqgF family)